MCIYWIKSRNTPLSTLLVLANFCPVWIEFSTWTFVYKIFWYFGNPKLSMKIRSSLNFFTFYVQIPCICYIGAKNFKFGWNNVTFDKQYLNTSLKSQNVEKLCLDLIFNNNFCQNIEHYVRYLLKTCDFCSLFFPITLKDLVMEEMKITMRRNRVSFECF